jgi:membrane protease YdiL (CAAX protease family)
MATTTLTAPEAQTLAAGSLANSPAAIQRRVAAGRVGWAGPVVMVFGRTALCVAAQALVALVFWLQGRAAPWEAAAAWWTVWGTLADLVCLAGLLWLLRREGLRLGDLFSFDRRRLGRDALLGLGIFLVLFPIVMVGGTMLASWLVFGTIQAPMYAGALTGRVLPVWGVVYSLTLWWLVWSPTEELTFNGYVLPRLEVLSGSRWLAVAVVGLLWAVMHAAIPALWDARYLAWRTLSFLPLCTTLAALYVWKRRLPPLIVAHWAMDIFGAVFTLAW